MFLESSLAGEHPLILVILGSYVAGILASLTPCIYPMIPITMGIITAQKTRSMPFNFFLSLAYGCGIATVYSALGYLCAKSNVMFGQWLASPWFIAVMVAFFLYLAFSMFGFYDVYTPSFLHHEQGLPSRKGSLAYSFMFGVITGAAASPCLTPALALLLGFAVKQDNPFVGFSVLFAFAMGLSTLLIVVGTFSGSMKLLPRAGDWMEEVKRLFGFMLLAVCVYYLQPLLQEEVIELLYALVATMAALFYSTKAPQKAEGRYWYTGAALAFFAGAGFLFLTAYRTHIGM